MAEMTIRVLLVDDSWEVRERLRILLLQEPDIELVGEAVSGEEALEMLERLPADVVVMDLNLQEISGIETARRILLEDPVSGWSSSRCSPTRITSKQASGPG